MYCTKCGGYLADDHQFCMYCGAARPVLPPSQKGTRWIPILLLTLMFTLGCFVYYFASIHPPVDETPALSVQFGTLYFDETQHEGGPELIVPETVDGQTVTGIGPYCFQNCDSLSSVTLPGTVEIIEPYAFFDCENLQTVKLCDGIQIIDCDAFYSCGSLETIYIPASVEIVDGQAFTDCRKLTHIYYEGTPENWSNVFYGEIGPTTQIHYASAT